jgi:SNF2 family DNA or RNA helicase
VTWLISLYQNGLNGILADQMGLGKTVSAACRSSWIMRVRTRVPSCYLDGAQLERHRTAEPSLQELPAGAAQ